MNILPIIQDPAFMQQARLAIDDFAKEVGEITYIEHGADNVVALVNREYVFRFPRNPDAAKHLYFETAVLQKVAKRLTAAQVPELIQVHTQPFYSVAKYIEGEHLTDKEIQSLTEAQQIGLGRTIATFITQLNSAISGQEISRLRTEARLDGVEEPWEAYFKRLFVDETLPNERLGPVINEHYVLWKDYIRHEQRIHAIHDDLHPANLLFLNSQLNGIVDFGDTNTGSIEEEMRWLYMMGDTVLKTAIEHYQGLTGSQVNYEHVRVWAIMHELSAYTSRLKKQQTESFPFLRSQEHLRAWLPGFPL
ncbi:MAG: aminoglycoside phosphotransferase family protein [Patescibacteria group bacterium]